MKILYLVTDDWYFLSHRAHLARSALEQGCEVVVVTAPGKRTKEIESAGFRFDREVTVEDLKENYVLRFRRP